MEEIYIRALLLDDVESLLQLRLRNRAFLEPFEPLQSDKHFTVEGQLEAIHRVDENWKSGVGFGFGIFLRDTNELIGRVNLSNVVRGAWQSCTIGYFMDQASNRKGYMTEAVRLACQFAFEEVDLHRVQAAVMPNNLASIRVVEKNGFLYEGLAYYYLKINGKWEDHRVFSVTKECWEIRMRNAGPQLLR
jgi:[ribosomal protein S5]-alanine N-acetyltransferase